MVFVMHVTYIQDKFRKSEYPKTVLNMFGDYHYLLLDLEWSYKTQENRLRAKKAIRNEWRLRTQESIDLQHDLRELEAPIPNLRAIDMWQAPLTYDAMEQTLLRIRVENNIMALRRMRYGLLWVCKNFLQANGQTITSIEEEQILSTPEYVSNSDEE
ncbi:hypothetical protein SESBI_20687 [Sesbania bispinosa]|nr:hypothetical protein SESBI_20687 [Sesbania bispinosa]